MVCFANRLNMKRKFLLPFFSLFFSAVFAQVSPEQIDGLRLWLKADTGIVLNGNNVVEWHDQSGNGNDAMQTDLGKAPIFVSSVHCLNFNPVIRFDGIDDVLNGTTLSGIDTSSLTFFVVFNGNAQNSMVNSKAMIFGINDTSGLWIFRNIYPAQERTEVINAGLTGYSSNLTAPANGFNYSIFCYYKKVNAYSNIFLNWQDYYITGNPLPFANANYYIGGNSYPEQTSLNGDITEIILYDTLLSIIERQEIIEYIDEKYGNDVDLGPDIYSSDFCTDTLDAGDCYTYYHWNTGESTQSIHIDSGGVYCVSVLDLFGYFVNDTIIVHKPSLTIESDTLCFGDSTIIHSGFNSPYTTLWEWNSDSTYSEEYLIHAGDTVNLFVYDTSGCFVSMQIYMVADSFPLADLLGPATLNICAGDTVFPVIDTSYITSYDWYDGSSHYSTSYFIIPDTWVGTGAHNISLACNNSFGCSATDGITINVPGQIPIAAFSSTAGCIPTVTGFTDYSTTQGTGAIIDSWLWDFGDGDTSYVQNPNHVFNNAGVLLVTLTITTNQGCSVSITDTALVYSIPEPAFAPLLGCSGIPLQFSDHTTNILGDIDTWQWDFNDPYSSSNFSSLQSPIHTFDSTGYYWVQLTSTSEYGCTATDSASVYIRPSPDVEFSYTDACDGNPVYFINETIDPLGIYQLYWDFGNGNIFTIDNPIFTFDSAGVYPVTLHIQSINGCIVEYTEYVQVFPLPVADFIVTPICVLVPYTFYDVSYTNAGDTISSWEWDFGDGSANSTDQNPVHVYTYSGTYYVQLSVQTVHGCQGSVAYNVIVTSTPPAPVITQIGNTLYSNSGIGNQWYNDSGIIPGATGQSYTPSDSGNYYVVVTYSAGCVSDTSNIIYFINNGIYEFNSLPEIMIYPNPVDGILNIEIKTQDEENVSVTIVNCLGAEIHNPANTTIYGKYKTMVDLSKYSEGVYSLIIKVGDNTVVRKLSVVR